MGKHGIPFKISSELKCLVVWRVLGIMESAVQKERDAAKKKKNKITGAKGRKIQVVNICISRLLGTKFSLFIYIFMYL